ncbi:MAG: DUF3276 family protein [Draconibacterium sp.]
MESVDNKGDLKNSDAKFNQDIYSKVVRAGKRTYFFDVKSTRNEEYYLTITESKKQFGDNGDFHYEKHKIFLYREDFEKFTDCLQEIVGYINKNQLPLVEKNNEEVESSEPAPTFTGVDFEDI